MNNEYVEKVIDRLANKFGENARTHIQEDIEWIFNNKEAWNVREIPGLTPKVFDSFREFITYRTPWGLGWTIKAAEAILLPEKPKIWMDIESSIEPALEYGTNRFTKESESKEFTCKLYDGGNKREYLISVLKRDAPEVAERVIKGEISARQGMILIGKAQPTTTHPKTLDGYFKAVRRDLSVHDRQELANMLIEDNLNFKK